MLRNCEFGQDRGFVLTQFLDQRGLMRSYRVCYWLFRGFVCTARACGSRLDAHELISSRFHAWWVRIRRNDVVPVLLLLVALIALACFAADSCEDLPPNCKYDKAKDQ